MKKYKKIYKANGKEDFDAELEQADREIASLEQKLESPNSPTTKQSADMIQKMLEKGKERELILKHKRTYLKRAAQHGHGNIPATDYYGPTITTNIPTHNEQDTATKQDEDDRLSEIEKFEAIMKASGIDVSEEVAAFIGKTLLKMAIASMRVGELVSAKVAQDLLAEEEILAAEEFSTILVTVVGGLITGEGIASILLGSAIGVAGILSGAVVVAAVAAVVGLGIAIAEELTEEAQEKREKYYRAQQKIANGGYDVNDDGIHLSNEKPINIVPGMHWEQDMDMGTGRFHNNTLEQKFGEDWDQKAFEWKKRWVLRPNDEQAYIKSLGIPDLPAIPDMSPFSDNFKKPNGEQYHYPTYYFNNSGHTPAPPQNINPYEMINGAIVVPLPTSPSPYDTLSFEHTWGAVAPALLKKEGLHTHAGNYPEFAQDHLAALVYHKPENNPLLPLKTLQREAESSIPKWFRPDEQADEIKIKDIPQANDAANSIMRSYVEGSVYSTYGLPGHPKKQPHAATPAKHASSAPHNSINIQHSNGHSIHHRHTKETKEKTKHPGEEMAAIFRSIVAAGQSHTG